ncbi:hypothetical protein R1flu_008025 [Riccia fluitans]|uniref:Uncharacterized protein n=1 Tax=Riccia fluitans TaxID=41844 RepID=A0ABD1YB68_9MARC
MIPSGFSSARPLDGPVYFKREWVPADTTLRNSAFGQTGQNGRREMQESWTQVETQAALHSLIVAYDPPEVGLPAAAARYNLHGSLILVQGSNSPRAPQ